ncbi:piggyBac transposable element-derived protein 1-like [Paramacrobiotus metropolitanus]|uniref:piggyBac transposable element-derived protein 1-like n=1 Tax=Paramacrobiotus metropolitanus TaxID=2943436 RepID=UPI002445ADB8|nr:piggyBac transposable element-derived protein 1-like [Paramacrobiotus metropolitanus]
MPNVIRTKRAIDEIESGSEAYSSDSECVDTDSDISDAEPEEADYESDTVSEDEDFVYSYTFRAKNNVEWSTASGDTGKTRTADKMTGVPGVRPHVRGTVAKLVDAFNVFFTKDMKAIILIHTNVKGKLMFPKSWTELDAIELDAFLGLLILHGVNHESKKPLCQLWNEAKGRPIYNATMSRNRFSEISSALRFDNKKSRYLRELTDKLAHIRELFELWVPTLRNSYLPGPYLTIDEQLYSFHGHCKFKQYIPKKPSKYGLKNFILADSASKYCCNIQVYTGKSPGAPPERNQGRRVVLDLVQYLGVDSGRNVTTDNFFTDLELGLELLKRNITLVGTMRKNKPDIPAAFLPSRERAEFSSLFGFTKEAALVSYVPKIGKAVILLSTHHRDAAVETTSDKKPVIITTYNETKAGVDSLDQMVTMYSVKRRTRRWQVILFYDMVDISALNAFVVWIELNPAWSRAKHRRRLFLESLAEELLEYPMRRRLELKHISATVRGTIKALLKIPEETGRPMQQILAPPFTGQKRCKVCAKVGE